MKEHKGRFSLLFGLFCLAATLLVGSLLVLPLFGIDSALLARIRTVLEHFFSFSPTPSLFGLVPLVFLLGIWTIMTFAFRGRRQFTFILVPFTALMAYTLYTLSHMLMGSDKPLFASRLLASSVDLRTASWKVVMAFLAETVVFIILILIGDGLERYQQRKAERIAKQEAQVEPKQKKRGSLWRRRKNVPEEEEQETVVLQKKRVAPLVEEQGNSFGEQQVDFPPIVDIPNLENLARKRAVVERPKEREVIEVDEIQVLGKVSIGALHTLTEERKRNNGVSYLERKQQELARKRQEEGQRVASNTAEGEATKSSAPLSGFLQGALEAVGKGTRKHEARRIEKSGHVQGMLAQAVEEHQARKETEMEPAPEPLAIHERVLSVRYEQPDPPAIDPIPVQPTFFAPESTAKPKNGAVLEEPQTLQVQQEEPESDGLQAESGVGGLSGRENGTSALLNRNRITYQFPAESMLLSYPKIGSDVDENTLKRGQILVSTLQDFNITVELTNIVRGPTVTMFELLPAAGVRVNSIVNLADNIALALAATQVRIVAPIPGKSAVGVEIPNAKRDIIGFREMLPSLPEGFGIPMVLGRNLMAQPIVIDVIKAPHLLIAGSTGSGKSVCVNSLICSVLFRRSPKQVRMILVDPKIVELNIYNGIPHLLTPVITDAKRTLKALDFCLYEMDRRYKLLQGINVRNIIGYNEKIEASHLAREKLPYILVVIDEFADLMHLVGKDMEMKVSRLAAMSRAVGIHLVLATQRPSVDVITGVIKNNIPTRIAFAVTSATDSRIILDEQGADKLLGKGDMLYMSSSNPATERIQGSFLSDQEVEQVVAFVSSQGEPDFIDESFFEDEESKTSDSDDEETSDASSDDELMERALAIVVERKCASASYLQRRLKIGYNRAARLVEQMEELGYVGPPNGSKPRELIKYP